MSVTVQAPAAGVAQGKLYDTRMSPFPLQQTVSWAKSPQSKMSDHCQHSADVRIMCSD